MRGEAMVIGVDVGSSSARAGVFTADGALLARAEAPFSVHRPATGFAEHSSDEIWTAVINSVRAATAKAGVRGGAIAGLAFDAACSLVMLARDGTPVTVSPTGEDRWNVIMWADHRATGEAEEISATRHRVLDHVGGVMSPEMEIPKLLWLRRAMPAAWSRYGIARDLADFLTWRATGSRAISRCTVTCKWTYLGHETRGWQTDFLASLGLADLAERFALPDKASEIGSPAGTLSAASAEELGLSTACVVGVGLIDAHAGGIGALGGHRPDDLNQRLAMIAGSSTCHMAASREPRHVPGVWGPYFGAMLPGLWLNEGGQSATGLLLDHILDLHHLGRAQEIGGHAGLTRMIEQRLAADGPSFAGELQVIPDFHGNRSPLADPHAKGVIHGLTLESDAPSLARLYFATAVGIALGTRHIRDSLDEKGYAIRHLHLTGGHVANPLLVRLYADATGCEIVLPAEADGVLLGTACVAAAAAGVHDHLTAAAGAMVRPGQVIHPDPGTRAFYDRRYRAFRRMLHHRAEISAIVTVEDDA